MHFSEKKERGSGILSIYILASINKNPQSGYDLLKNIREKTSGKWMPSKGALYTLIKQMEKNTLIKVKKLGKRSKKIFELTNKGRETLNNIHKNKGITKEKILAFRNIISEIFGEHISSYGEYILDIKELSFSIDASKKDQVIKILKKCKLELKKIK